jgi:hypothetical protein
VIINGNWRDITPFPTADRFYVIITTITHNVLNVVIEHILEN